MVENGFMVFVNEIKQEMSKQSESPTSAKSSFIQPALRRGHGNHATEEIARNLS